MEAAGGRLVYGLLISAGLWAIHCQDCLRLPCLDCHFCMGTAGVQLQVSCSSPWLLVFGSFGGYLPCNWMRQCVKARASFA